MKDYSSNNQGLNTIEHIAIAIENIEMFFLDVNWYIIGFIAFISFAIFFTHLRTSQLAYIAIVTFVFISCLFRIDQAIPLNKWRKPLKNVLIELSVITLIGISSTFIY